MDRHRGTRSLSAFGLAGILGYHYSAAGSTEGLFHSCGVIQTGPRMGQLYYLDRADFDTLVNCFVESRDGQALIEVDDHGVDTHSTTVFGSDGRSVRADQRFVGDYGPPTHTSARCRTIGIVPAGAVVFDCGVVQMTFTLDPLATQAWAA